MEQTPDKSQPQPDRKEEDVEQTPSKPESPNRTLMLVLSYLGILALVPLLVEKDDAEIQWHAKHGLVLSVSWIVLFIGLGLIGVIAGTIPVVGWVVSIVLGCGTSLLPLGILVLHIVAMVKAVKGERLTVPVITDFANRWQ